MDAQKSFLNYSEQTIMADEYCYLLLSVFGGFKTIRNDRRIINNIMVIICKVFEFEIQDHQGSTRIDYSIDDILHNRVDCAFQRIHRLVFYAQN